MKKILKITGIIILIVVLAIVLIPFAFKGKISEAILTKAHKNVNAEISYRSFQLSLIKSFPDLNASFNDVAVVGIDDFEGDTLIAFERLSAQVDARSVFGDEGLLIKSLRIDKALMHLIQEESGNVNWLISNAGEPEAEKENEHKKEPLKLQLSDIVVIDFDFTYHSKKYNYLFSASNIDGVMSGKTEGMDALLAIEAATPSVNLEYDSVRYITNSALNLSTQLDADLERYNFIFRSGKSHINGMPVDLDGGFSMSGDSMLFDVDFNVPEIDVHQVLSIIPDAFQKYMKDIEATGNVDFGGNVKGAYFDDIYPGMDIG
ncbi:MAG TPA: AsmA family protein, partial [Prolixibacteraceae bacterium]|nr:AsmA family protein [Prolixibacteraceae bacterium]